MGGGGDLHDEAFCSFLFYSGYSFFMFSRMVLAFLPCLMSLVPTWIITVFPFSASSCSYVAQNFVSSDVMVVDLVVFQLFRFDFMSGSILPVFESPTMIMVGFSISSAGSFSTFSVSVFLFFLSFSSICSSFSLVSVSSFSLSARFCFRVWISSSHSWMILFSLVFSTSFSFDVLLILLICSLSFWISLFAFGFVSDVASAVLP